MKTIFGYYVIKVPGTWTYRFLKAKDFEPNRMFNYRNIYVEDLSNRIDESSRILLVDDDVFDKHVNEVLNIQLNQRLA